MAVSAILELRSILEGEYFPACSEVKEKLNVIGNYIREIGPEARNEAIEAGAYEVIVDAWLVFCNSGEDNIKMLSNDAAVIREAVLYALAALTLDQPTIIDRNVFVMLLQAFDPSVPESTKIQALKLMRNICIKSEANRELLTSEWNITPPFVELIKADALSQEFVRQWCGTLKAFTLNDDRTIAYNRAAERKRMIFELGASEYIVPFLLKYTDECVLNTIIVAITLLATHDGCCIAIQAAGGLDAIQKILVNFKENDRLVKNAINCTRYLTISATVREKIGSTLLVRLILEAAVRMQSNASCMEIIMSCLAYMTLHHSCGAAQFLSERGVPTTLEIMKANMENQNVLKGCCLLLRNVASLAGKLGRLNVLEAGGEAVLRDILKKHEDLAETHVKPALRDLGFEEDVLSRRKTGLDYKMRQRIASTPFVGRSQPK